MQENIGNCKKGVYQSINEKVKCLHLGKFCAFDGDPKHCKLADKPINMKENSNGKH